MLRKLMSLENQPGIIVVHYWAGKEMGHNYSDTVEDSINTILKVPSPSSCTVPPGVLSCKAMDLRHKLCAAVLWPHGAVDAGLVAPAAHPGRGSGGPHVPARFYT